MGEITERFSRSEVMRAIEALPERTKRRAGIAAGGGATLAAIASLAGNVYQMHLADGHDARTLAAKQTEAAICESRVEKAWTRYGRHMCRKHNECEEPRP